MDASDLQQFDLFDGLNDEELASCASLFEERRVLMGERLTEEADFSYSFFLLLDGAVKVTVDGEQVDTMQPGDSFGEAGLVNEKRRNADVVATETCRVAKLMTWDFDELVATNAVLAERIKAQAEARHR